ncbi:MAG: preprotein translocase subunit SecE [Coriobacteriia bacterium]|nr:preprotein translocase subunit SecE [Coriobacteriia bacterium]
MAKKSKTQRAKASEKRAAKKLAAQEQIENGQLAESDDTASASAGSKQDVAKTSSKKEEKPKKQRFKFLREVRSEMKRVTWPTRQDVLRWSGVVVCALLFFGLYVALLDNAIITPLLVAFSGLGA